MAVGFTSTQLIALSGLLQDRGLQQPAALRTRILKLLDTATLTGKLSYIANHPRIATSHPEVITAMRTYIPAQSLTAPIATTSVPVGFRLNDVVGTLQGRGDAILANGLKGFLDNLSVAKGAISSAYDVLGSIDHYSSMSFDDILPGSTRYLDLITGGFTAVFGHDAKGTPSYDQVDLRNTKKTAAQRIEQNKRLITSLNNIKNLHDFTDLEHLGQAAYFIKHLYNVGAYWNTNLHVLMTEYGYDVGSISSVNNLPLTQLLRRVGATDVATILKVTGATVPDSKLISSAADLLVAAKIIPADLALTVSNGDLAGLGQKLIYLGITSADFDEVLAVADGLSIVDIPYLDALTKPLPATDQTNLKNTLLQGNGVFLNPTVDDILGAVSGTKYNTVLDSLIFVSKYLLSTTGGTALSVAADTAITKLQATTFSSGDATTLIAAINTFAADTEPAQKVTESNTAIALLVAQLKMEFENTEKVNLQFSSNLRVNSTPTLIDSFAANTYRSAHYSITVQNGADYEASDVLVIHNGTTANLVTYGQTWTTDKLGETTANISTATGERIVNVYYTGAVDNEDHYYLRRRIDYIATHDGADPGTLTGSSSEINTILRLTDIAQTNDSAGVEALIKSMVADDIYGDAIEACLTEARNENLMQNVGITLQRPDPVKRALEKNAATGTSTALIKLTEAQKTTVIQEALTRGVSAEEALSHATMYGINRAYYEDRGWTI